MTQHVSDGTRSSIIEARTSIFTSEPSSGDASCLVALAVECPDAEGRSIYSTVVLQATSFAGCCTWRAFLMVFCRIPARMSSVDAAAT
jgi:hypothetical protein